MRKELLYHKAGLCVLPADPASKRPTLLTWKAYQKELPTDTHIDKWFSNGHAGCCIITGAVSGNLEMLDFDCQGEMYQAWCESLDAAAPGLRARLVVERSPSGGYHVIYRCDVPVSGNLKLANRRIETGDETEVQLFGKTYRPRNGHVTLCMIETRGTGGLFLCDPTPGYEVIAGEIENVPTITEAERDAILSAAYGLNEHYTQKIHPTHDSATGEFRPGDDFNERGNIPALLMRHGWTLHKDGPNQQWCRPGKAGACSATLKDRVFYVFTTSCAPLENNVGYAPFALYAMLEHGGDFKAAAISLRGEGYGDIMPNQVDLAAFRMSERVPDVAAIPDSMFRVPGFVGELMDFSLRTAPYPNVAMAFCGALAMQAFLCGRKIRDSGDNRPNIYLLGLANSGSGKDWSRRINMKIAHAVGLSSSIGDHFASGEGIQDALYAKPNMLFQTDEIDGILQSLKHNIDSRHEAIMGTLLTMYSASASVFPMRKKAVQKGKVVDMHMVINQPSLTMFGTAIPAHYYDAISGRMLTNGLFARMIVIEGGPRSAGQEPLIVEPPASIMSVARFWGEQETGEGLVEGLNPDPMVVDYTDSARSSAMAVRIACDEEYAKAEGSGDPVAMAVWSRVNEQTRKLALIYAASENAYKPQVGVKAVEWASGLAMHVARRMLSQAEGRVADNPFEVECLKMVGRLRESGGKLPHSIALKRMKLSARVFGEVVSTLAQRGDIAIDEVPTATNTYRQYRII